MAPPFLGQQPPLALAAIAKLSSEGRSSHGTAANSKLAKLFQNGPRSRISLALTADSGLTQVRSPDVPSELKASEVCLLLRMQLHCGVCGELFLLICAHQEGLPHRNTARLRHSRYRRCADPPAASAGLVHQYDAEPPPSRFTLYHH